MGTARRNHKFILFQQHAIAFCQMLSDDIAPAAETHLSWFWNKQPDWRLYKHESDLQLPKSSVVVIANHHKIQRRTYTRSWWIPLSNDGSMNKTNF